MLNFIWAGMIAISVCVAILEGRVAQVVQAVTDSAKLGFQISLGLAGIMALWLGILAIANEAGLIKKLAYLLRPVMKWLFPEVPTEHPAMGAMIMNIAANMLGLANAATPFGLKAMKELQKLNHQSQVASDSMCTFLAINTSSVQLIPATAIAILAAQGSIAPTNIIFSSLIATSVSTIVAIIAVKLLGKLAIFSRQ